MFQLLYFGKGHDCRFMQRNPNHLAGLIIAGQFGLPAWPGSSSEFATIC
jgi:hypothetical protein